LTRQIAGIKTGASIPMDTLKIKKGVNPVKKGFTLIELLIVVAIIAILAAIAVPNFLEAQVRAKVSRVRSDQRSLATAIESYYVDNNTYPLASRAGVPAFATGANANYNAALATALAQPPARVTALGAVPTFAARSNAAAQQFATLTTPIGYFTSYPADPFHNFRQATFNYAVDNTGNRWILISNGPDLIGGLVSGTANPAPYNGLNATTGTTLETLLGAGFNPETLTPFLYDPTNGTISAGDVIRLKQ
jgi:prepilin-type N-terminal cleavage/methylation domain-containing protein